MSAVFRSDEIVSIINGGTYPYPLQFFPHEVLPNKRIFNYVEVVNVQPDGTIENFDVTTETNVFEVRIFVKYNQYLDLETEDLATVENVILTLLEAASLGDKKIVLEAKQWLRTSIKNNPNNVHGRQSTLTVRIEEVKSTSGLGVVGGDWTVSLPGLLGMQLLNKSIERDLELFDNRYNDAISRVGSDFVGETRSFFGEVEANDSRMTALRTLKNARDVISATLSRNGVDEVVNCKIVSISNAAPFSSIETVTFQLEVLP